MILVDTSAWIDFFRNQSPLASRVDAFLETGEAAVCGPTQLEMRRGIRNQKEKELVLDLLHGCRLLIQPADLWEEAGDLGAFLAKKGENVKDFDLLIAIYAIHHDVELLTGDRDFAAIVRSGIPLRLVL